MSPPIVITTCTDQVLSHSLEVYSLLGPARIFICYFSSIIRVWPMPSPRMIVKYLSVIPLSQAAASCLVEQGSRLEAIDNVIPWAS
jgi:hypothetical protein